MGKTTHISEAIARPVRTAVQGGPAWVITEFVDAWFYDMSDRQYGVLVLLLTMLIGYIQTAVENAKGKGFLRAVPSAKVPIADTKNNGAA